MLAITICINKTQDTILVSCQMDHKIVFTHTLVLLCLLIYDISYIEVYLALAITICINKTQDTILVSCQIDHNIVFTHTLVLDYNKHKHIL